MTKTQIEMLAGMDPTNALNALNRILAERVGERTTILRVLRADLPDLYQRWLSQSTG